MNGKLNKRYEKKIDSNKELNYEEDSNYESNIDYDKIAEEVFDDMLKYKVKNESITHIIEEIINKHGNFTDKERLQIEADVIHVMTVAGYDIECVKPFKMKKYKD